MVKYYVKQVLISLLILSAVISTANFYFAYKYPLNYNGTIINEASAFSINADLICAVIAVESRFNKNVVSRSGAVGLMQLMPDTARSVAEELEMEGYNDYMLFEPEVNIRLGTKYLRYLKDKFVNISTVLAAYNAGEGLVSEWLNDPKYSDDGFIIKTTPYRETNAYVDNVMNALKIYRNKRR
jgi:soluble lytic murein transglycosylase